MEAYRANALFDAHKDDREFGHRLLADEARDNGEAMSDRTAWRIASSNGWFSAFGKPKRSKARRPGPPVHDDLCAVVDEHGRVRHVFAADAPAAVVDLPVDVKLVGEEDQAKEELDILLSGEGLLHALAVEELVAIRVLHVTLESTRASYCFVVARQRGGVERCVGCDRSHCLLHHVNKQDGGFLATPRA
ncbi:hypothetical protein ACLKM7_10770 [Microbacterium sp. I2]|uniref:Uncharacterized protein n=1 Tax=Microbacterium terregens TaxID=69363 RepID=A0ABV5T432_9MICO